MSDAIINGLLEMANDTIRKIGIVMDPGDLKKWNRALTRVETEARRQALEIPRQHSVDYMNMLIGNIASQKHMSGYKNYNKDYGTWKQQFHGGLSFWNLFGDLIAAISYRRVSSDSEAYAWFAGVPAGVMDSGGKSWFGKGDKGPAKEIAWYGGIMEGTIKTTKQEHPARPIFEPTRKEYVESGEPVIKAEKGFLQVVERWR